MIQLRCILLLLFVVQLFVSVSCNKEAETDKRQNISSLPFNYIFTEENIVRPYMQRKQTMKADTLELWEKYLRKHGRGPLSMRELRENFPTDKLDRLAEIAQAKDEKSHEHSRMRRSAIRIMGAIGGSKECRILGKIVQDEQEKRRIRTAAAYALSLMPEEMTEPHLIQALESKDEEVLFKVIKALDRVGGKESYEKLVEFENHANNRVKTRAKFARLLIAYRSEMRGVKMPFIDGQKRESRKRKLLSCDPPRHYDIHVNRATQEEIRNCLDNLEGNTMLIPINEKLGCNIVCGKDRYVFLVNKELGENPKPSEWKNRNFIPGLLAWRSNMGPDYYISHVFFCSSNASNMEIMITIRLGPAKWSGKGIFFGNSLNFILTDINTTGVRETLIKGCITDQGFDLQEGYIGKNVYKVAKPHATR